jgi:NADPH-dependent glutamate synthase beta subunit-like oxidoreductase
MVEAVVMMGGLGLFVGVCLAIASKVFYVYVDPKILAVGDSLPGANCGGCGLPGCSANAEAIVAGKASPASCVAGGPDLALTIAEIMGVTVEAKEPDIARPGCYYGVTDADQKYVYTGLDDCRAAAILSGGMKICRIGCLGLGTCARACPFDAIFMGPDGLPVVDEIRCTGCGTCERVCPKHIINLSSVTRRILREYTSTECTTPCQRSCPAGINIREYIRQVAEGNYHQAVQIIKERNPFPAVIGRICPRPCELDCRRKYIDEPVAINFLKRYAADMEKESGQPILPYKAPDTGREIAVVGGGIEGLSTAYFTARLGHKPTVFEATSQLGGLIRYAIAQYRLSPEILDQDGILKMGVTTRTGQALGRDLSIDSLLRQGFEAIFLASGGWDSRLLRDQGATVEESLPNTYLLLDVIRSGSDNAQPISCGSDVVIAGGGKLAMDAAKTCFSNGAEKVTLLFRETLEAAPLTDADMASLESDNITVIFNAAIGRLFGVENNLTELEYVDLESSSTVRIPAYSLILASGRFPELILTKSEIKETDELEGAPLQWEATIPYKRPDQLEEIGLLSEGDVLSDYSAAIKAIAAGRRAAASIHQIMYGIPLIFPENIVTPESIVQNVDQVENVQACSRRIMPLGDQNELEAGGDLEKGFSREMAQAEAARCLQCGLICYERPVPSGELNLSAAAS